MRDSAPTLVVATRTDVGRYRKNNEDFLGHTARTEPLEEGARIFCVADGMGGLEAGEEASQAAVEGALGAWRRGSLEKGLGALLEECVRIANETVVEKARELELEKQIGTTIVALAVYGRQLAIAHVGDSRIYRLRDGTLRQMTVDHTEAEPLIAAGEMTRAEANRSAASHMLTRCLGILSPIESEVRDGFELRDDDVYLLCSDGLSGMVGDGCLCEILSYFEPEAAADTLIKLANFNGGWDNITVVVVRAGARSGSLIERPKRHRLPHEGTTLGRAFVLLCMLLFMISIMFAIVL